MLTSTDLKTWTILNGTQRTEASGDKPGTFTTNGVMTLVDNINPLGNMVLVYTMSDDFGVTWKDNPAKMIFNTELPNGSLAQISYAGPSEIKRTNYSSTLQRLTTLAMSIHTKICQLQFNRLLFQTIKYTS
jgi:hypothetical protein